MIAIYEIINPWTYEPFFVGWTADLEGRITAQKLWAGSVRLTTELQDIRAAGKEPIYEIIETVNSKDTVKRLDYWIGERLQRKANLFNKLPAPVKFKNGKIVKPKPRVLSDLNVEQTVSFTVSLPRSLAEDPRFKSRLTPSALGADFFSAYVGQLILQDFAKEENSSLIDFIDWLYV